MSAILTDEELDQINIEWWESSKDRHPAELRRLVARAAARKALGEAQMLLAITPALEGPDHKLRDAQVFRQEVTDKLQELITKLGGE